MTRAIGLLLIALGVLVLTPPGTALSELATQSGAPVDGFAEPDDADDPNDDYVIAENPDAAADSDGPELVPGQPDRAIALALGDPRVKQRLSGKQHYVEGSGPWSTGGANDSLVGAIVVIRLTAAANFPPSDWPVPDYDGPDDTSYSETNIRVSAENVTELVVSVDLTRDRVIGIEPDGDDVRITPEEDPPPPPCRPWLPCES